MLNDEYLFWTISEGGAPVGSAMPAFKEMLTEEEIWKIVVAMRAGFPVAGEPQEQGEPTREPAARELSVADVRTQLEQWVLLYGNPRLKVGSVIEKNDKTISGEIVTLDNSVVQRVEVDRETGWMRPVQ